MKIKNGFGITTLLLLSLILASCGTNKVDTSTIQTQAVSTFASSLTETMVPPITQTPTLTSLPTFTAAAETATIETLATANPCYNLIWIKDMTIPDGTQMKAGQAFTKTWQVQNNGGCAWAPGFSFSHVGGDSMQGKTLVLTEPIPVGAKRELSINFIVPGSQNGLIQSSWRMADQNGNFFGDTLSVNINVGTVTTPTP